MSEKILLANAEEQKLVLNNNCYQATDNEHYSTIDKCYQCILCSPMFFQRKRIKNRLWGLRVTTTPASITSSSPQHNEQQFHPATVAPYHHPSEPYSRTMNGGGGAGGDVNTFLSCCGNSNGSMNGDHVSMAVAVSSSSTTDQLFLALAKKLTERQLHTLCQAVERGATCDGQATNCVLVPRSAIDGEEPHVIACRIWRWADLRCADELKRIPSCPNEMDPVYVCCNPTHWYRHTRSGIFKSQFNYTIAQSLYISTSLHLYKFNNQNMFDLIAPYFFFINSQK